MPSIQFGNKKISYSIQRGNRKKSVAIHIDRQGEVKVFAPMFFEGNKIKAILSKKALWISEKQDQIKNNSFFYVEREFVSGESFPFLGKSFRLKIFKTPWVLENKCQRVNGRLGVWINNSHNEKERQETIKGTVVKWYKIQAEKKIRERISLYSRMLGILLPQVEIKEQKKRWGSCSRNGTIRFNWKIIFTPISILDYVIVHELCHISCPNHSNQFWQKLGSVLPDYKKRRLWLKENSHGILQAIE